MPKIPALPPMTTVDTADQIPIEDVSTGNTKYITLTKLKEWFQSLAAWVGKSNIDFSSGIWWEELGRSTAVTAVPSLSVTFPTRKHIKIIAFFEAANASSGANIYVNNDNGSGNYRRRHTYNNASSVTTLTSDSSFLAALTTTTAGEIGMIDGTLANANSTTREKIFTFVAGTITDHRTGISQWKTTSNAVTTISMVTSPAGNMGIGSSLIILGHD